MDEASCPPGKRPRVVAVIATLPSRAEVVKRAIKSVLEQSRLPDSVIVVVDLPPDSPQKLTEAERHAETDECLAQLRRNYGGVLHLVKNHRTKNVSGTGCWNTGIMAALEMEGSDYNGPTCNTFVAILDDDDEWTSGHLQSCVDVCSDADWIVPGLTRDSGRQRTHEMATLETLRVCDFLRGNPGVQGSNIFVRLPLILRAGMFDENMNSMTDRDLCIRLIDALGPKAQERIAFTGTCSVIHHADPIDVRPRVTTDRPAKVVAIQKFLWRYAHRFSVEDFEAFSARARDKFQIDVQRPQPRNGVTPSDGTMQTMSGDLVHLPQHALSYLSSCQFYLNESPASPETLTGLLGIISSDTRRLKPLLDDISALPKHINVSVIVFANTMDPIRLSDIRQCVDDVSGVAVKMITADDDFVLRIAQDYCRACGLAKLAVPAYEIGIARTILQLCMFRELSEQTHIEFAMVLDDDKRLPKHSFLSAAYIFSLDRSHIYIGQDCKTAPNTLANGLRTQLRDLAFALERGNSLNNEMSLMHGPTEDGATSCQNHPLDSYYDLSTSRFDHLEEPQVPSSLDNIRNRVLRGDPLARVALPQAEQGHARQRGGCMLIFRQNFSSLQCPQVLPEIIVDETCVLSRRSDSIWLAAQAQNIPCTILPGLFVLHENHFDGVPLKEKFRRNALAETCGSVLCRPQQDRRAYLQRRVCAMLSNNERIRGLIALIRRSGNEELNSMADEIDDMFDEEAWNIDVFRPLAANMLLLLEWTAATSVSKWKASISLREAQLIPEVEHYEFIGTGNEGVVFRNSSRAIKVFLGEFPSKAIQLLCTKNVLDCRNEGNGLISYNFTEGECYKGGHGKQLVEMLRRLKDMSVVMTNVNPANIVVSSDGELKLVDLGRDWKEFTPELWMSMCRRGFLSWRFAAHCSTLEGNKALHLLMKRERTESSFAELTGFDKFFQCCENGFSPFLDPTTFEKTTLVADIPESRPASKKCTFLIKTCLMESKTILANVRHLVWAMKRSGTVFDEVVLSVDRTKRANHLRQYECVDELAFNSALKQINQEKLVDRVHDFDGSAFTFQTRVKELNKEYFGVSESLATHSESGESHASLFSALKSITTELVLQVDSDICVNIHEHDDLIARAARTFDSDPLAVTVLALPIYCKTPQCGMDGFAYRDQDAGLRPYRFEIRFSFLHLARFRGALPLQLSQADRSDKPEHILKKVGWYRIFDQQLLQNGLRSYRFFSPRGFWLHPTNDIKVPLENYMLLADRVSSFDVVRQLPRSGILSPSQEAWNAQNSVNINASKDFFGERSEKLVFVCWGHNVSYGRALRCLESVYKQRGGATGEIGVIVVDDGSFQCPAALFEASRCLFPGRVTNIYTGVRLGFLQSANHAIKRVCVNPESIIVVLDLDHFLLEQPEAEPSAIEQIQSCFFEAGWKQPTKCLVALGGMVCPEYFQNYPVQGLICMRHGICAGSSWKHVRCFKKRLFDAIPDKYFRIDGEWITTGESWAFMVPIVESAGPEGIYELSAKLVMCFEEDSLRHVLDDEGAKSNDTTAYLKALPPFEIISNVPVSAPPLLAVCTMPIDRFDRIAHVYTYKRCADGTQARVLVCGDVRDADNVTVRIHSECFSGDVLGSLRCDCGLQKARFIKMMESCECAVLLYICGHEGRGNGWDNKMREYALADEYPERNHNEILCSLPGCVSDCRNYTQAAALLRDSLGIRSVSLHTNNPSKEAALVEIFGRSRVSVMPVPADIDNTHSFKYLLEKVALLGHDSKLLSNNSENSWELLKSAVRSTLEQIPFQNLSLMIGGIENTRTEELGLCFDRNVHLLEQLKTLGFESGRVVGARTRFFCETDENCRKIERGIPLAFNHIVLLVTLENQDYLVDVGNGFPYFTPLAITAGVGTSKQSIGSHLFLEYRVRMISSAPMTFSMEHCRPRERTVWKGNYTFCPDDVLSDHDVAQIIHDHANDRSFGHMLHSLRINRWSMYGVSVMLRDLDACLVRPDGVHEEIKINSADELAGFVKTFFGEGMYSKLNKAAPILLENVKMKETSAPRLAGILLDYILRDSTSP